MLDPLLKAEAARFSGCELLPAVAVAVPVVGRENVPRTVALPFTSRLVVGALVLMPTLAVGDVPDWNNAELPMVATPVNSGKNPVVPAPVIVPGGTTLGAPVVAAGLVELLPTTLPDAARANADAGKPPTVCASPAFIA